jgi:cation transport regulator ChaC
VKQEQQRCQLDDGQQHSLAKASEYDDNQQKVEEMFPGIPIVRGNTPRPLSFNTMISSGGQWKGGTQINPEFLPAFPRQAPSAPPLPEELIDQEEDAVLELSDPLPVSNPVQSDFISDQADQSGQSEFALKSDDFIWLFEYGLEMDAAILNSPERLRGLALPYGPAVLKGYKVEFGAQYIRGHSGSTIVAIESSSEPGAEVWGVLYRIPRSLSEPGGAEPSLLDTIHAAITPQKFFEGVQVVVHEIHHDRDVTSTVYVATETAHEQLKLASADQWTGDSSFSQRLATIAQNQKLPTSYILQYPTTDRKNEENLTPPQAYSDMGHDNKTMPPLSSNSAIGQYDVLSSSHSHLGEPMLDPPAENATTFTPELDEHNTEPLPTFGEHMYLTTKSVQNSFVSQANAYPQRWLTIFSLYLVGLLFVSLLFAVLQGLGVGHTLVTGEVALLGVPWLVLMYGLLGGCVSCIVTLGRFRTDGPPVFIIISWFTRPFVGAILAILAYLLLTCGMFSFGENMSNIGNHMALFLLTGALAGFGESWIFFKRS